MTAPNTRAEALQQLREPFSESATGKLPKVWCWDCNAANKNRVGSTCNNHIKDRCKVCRSYISTAHDHVAFVGHAEVTDRLLDIDPEWNWEPFALDARGLPQFDDNGGLWIRLTVCGLTRIGYGDAEGKRGTRAVKEAIGDALRNASMRFGVALDQWAKSNLHGDEAADGQQPASGRPRRRLAEDVEHVSPQHAAVMDALFTKRGVDQNADRQRIASQIIGRRLTGVLQLTPDEAQIVIKTLSDGELPVPDRAAATAAVRP